MRGHGPSAQVARTVYDDVAADAELKVLLQAAPALDLASSALGCCPESYPATFWQRFVTRVVGVCRARAARSADGCIR
jgi:hypothetical protein